jgi:hypothetical protein
VILRLQTYRNLTLRLCAGSGAIIIVMACCAGCGTTNNCPSNANSSSNCTIIVGKGGSVPDAAPSTSLVTGSPTGGSPPGGSPPPPSSSPPSSLTEVGYYLADFNTVQTYGINADSTPRTVNGVTYDHSVSWAASPGAGDPWWAEWDLSRKCTWLTSPGVGISDEAPSGSVYIFYVQTDGSYKWQRRISLGQSDGLKISIKGALRLRLSVAALQNAYGAPYATWGNAQVSCSSEPPNRKV